MWVERAILTDFAYLCSQLVQTTMIMANKERADKWLTIVAEDMSVADDLFKTG